jgi:hypothetical protein
VPVRQVTEQLRPASASAGSAAFQQRYQPLTHC